MFVDRFKITTRRAPEGGYYWYVYRLDEAVERAIGDGWARIGLSGHAALRSVARQAAREALYEWVYREDHPEEVEEIVEVERSR